VRGQGDGHVGCTIDGTIYHEFPDHPLPLVVAPPAPATVVKKPVVTIVPSPDPVPAPVPDAPIDPQFLVTDALPRQFGEQQSQKAERAPVAASSAPAPIIIPAPETQDSLLRLLTVVEGLATACDGFATACATAAVNLRALAAEIATPESKSPAPESPP
jgi:hypothetical protein